MKTYAARSRKMALALVSMCGLLTGLLVACQDSSRVTSSGDQVSVKVPAYKDGSYKFETLTLSTLQDLIEIRGEAARFLFSPRMDKGELVGVAPRARVLKNKDGVFVPMDALSAQMLAIYASLEKLMKLDADLGVKNVNRWPRVVAMNTKISDSENVQNQNNALYSGSLDAMLFVPYVRDDLPLAVNAAVIGHEHFHSLFYKMVLQKLGGSFAKGSGNLHDSRVFFDAVGVSESVGQELELSFDDPTTFHVMLMRAYNEGLADVWGWILTGDVDFVKRSLKFEKVRNLDLDVQPVPTRAEWEKSLSGKSVGTMTTVSYEFGSQLARLIKQTAAKQIVESSKHPSNSQEVRRRTAKAIIMSLNEIPAAIQAVADKKVLRPSYLIELFAKHMEGLDESTCADLQSRVSGEPEAKVCPKSGGEK